MPSRNTSVMDSLKETFSSITEKYDFLNHLLSLGQDILWRKFAVKKMRFFETRRLLDLACGTCDISILAMQTHKNIKVFGVDFAEKMLLKGKEKLDKSRLSDHTVLLQGDALSLPFKDSSFDVSIMAFGLRNIKDRESAIKEMARVTCPSGQVMILEMTLNGKILFKPLFKLYLKKILPYVGEKVSGNREAYLHLSHSIFEFLEPNELKSLMENAGLKDTNSFPLFPGITWLHIGIKPY